MLPECPRATIGAILDAPEPGHFAIRLGSRMPWTPAIIYLPCPFVEPPPWHEDWPPPEDWLLPNDRPIGPLRARVGEVDVEATDMILKIWQGGRAIAPYEYAYLMARRAWARKWEPASYHARRPDLRVLKNRDLM